ncbi:MULTISPECIES: hypothetical protein [unclassified Prochlorococcus]|nr:MULTISPECIES: hypothetical protein [unclassified Prochlorococcus]KGG29537.1 hypothetical protein EV12_0135 [Prochlorococcus sp. MIT 0701]KGG30319.1 hypothetical protein EV13_0339 [Prochlorococcus sp. MIT 0702]KGG35736.1 hypothetical protein EV14_0744 [Prochlorococcus sp. MIT 0703]
MNLFTAYFLFLITAFFPLSIKSQPSKGITNGYDYYSPWSPGDAGVHVDKDGYVFDPCMSRFPEDCEKEPYINLGKWKRISNEVMQTPKGTYFCRNDALKRDASTNDLFSCTKEGWVKKICKQGRCVMGGMGDL